MNKTRIRNTIGTVALSLLASLPLSAQIKDDVFSTAPRLKAGQKQELRFEMDNLNFFQNNEFKGGVDDGYTLPGLWLQPRITYQPLANLKLEAGAHLLYYSGAAHYPSGNYQDLPYWPTPDERDGKGLHARPYFRVQLSGFDNKLNLVLGNLHGGTNHRLAEPLYNPERMLSNDPESGLQVLFNSRRFDLDVWIDWRNFIFRQDNEREQFTLALSSRIKFGKGWYIPIQAVGQHLGGEIQQEAYHGISSLLNAATGISYDRTWSRPWLKRTWADLQLVYYKQLAGHFIPLEDGYGIHADGGVRLRGLSLQGGYMYSDRFFPLLGSPYFGSLSVQPLNTIYPKAHLVYERISYTHRFGKVCSVGVDVTLYHRLAGTGTDSESMRFHYGASTSVLAGIYLRTHLSTLLARLPL